MRMSRKWLEEHWDGGSIVGAGGWRLAKARLLLDVRNGTAAEQGGRQKRKKKECHCIFITSFKCNGPTGVLLFALYNSKKVISLFRYRQLLFIVF